MTPSSTSSGWDWRLGAVLALGLALRVAFFSGYVGGDDAGYIAHASAYARGNFSPPYSHWGVRVGIVAPTALMFYFWGINSFTIGFLPLLLSMVGIVLAYRLGDYLFDKQVGLLSALFVAVFPMDVLFASQLFPNAFLGTFATGSLFLFVKGMDQERPRTLLGAGLLLGAAYLCHITTVFSFLFFALYYLWRRPRLTLVAPMAIGFAVVVGAEALLGLWQSGDPLQRLHANMRRGAELQGTLVTLGWLIEPFVRPLFEQEIGPWWLLMVAAMAFAALRIRQAPYGILLVWCLTIYLYLVYGTQSFSDYNVLRRLPRYVAHLVIPWMVLSAAFVASWRSQRFRVATVAVLTVASVAVAALDNSPHEDAFSQELKRYVEARPSSTFLVPRPLYYDLAVARGLRFDPRIQLFAKAGDESHELKRIRIVHPEVSLIETLPQNAALHVVADGNYLTGEDVAAAGLRQVDVISEPDRFYHRLLSSKLVLSALSWVRDPKRLSMLQRGTRTVARVYARANE